MPYRVEVPEPLLTPFRTQIRTRVWLALARVAQAVEKAPGAQKQNVNAVMLGEGYSASYRIDTGTRTVSLVGVEQVAEAAAASP